MATPDPETLGTEAGAELPWRGARREGDDDALHLVIAWSLDEPGRVGEVAPIDGPRVLGRGGPQPEDRVPRLVFRKARPGANVETGPLESPRISRVQLRLQVEGGALIARNVGKTPLLLSGAPVERASLRAGDVVALRNAMVLLCVRRPRALEPLRAFPSPTFPFGAPDPFGMVGESPALWRLRDALALAAKGPHHVLVQGESGSGKELAARAIHALSARAARPPIARNAATFPEGLVDAELFGTARSYPNAGSPERPGLIGEADGSTLFLDEIGELSPTMQAHLLRVLDRGGEYQRLGESKVRASDLRLVAATNRSIDALKHDFAARLAARVEVPGLGDRVEDVPLLARHLVLQAAESAPDVAGRFVDRSGRAREPRIDPTLIEALLRRPWTHHLRELDRLLWTAIAQSRGEFVESCAAVREPAVTATQRREIDPTAEHVRAALAAHAGNVTRAARHLGLKNRYVLYRLMRRLGVHDPRAAQAEGD